ncbi:MAG: hypothetical protein WAK98_18840 [Gemmobacter sp.]
MLTPPVAALDADFEDLLLLEVVVLVPVAISALIAFAAPEFCDMSWPVRAFTTTLTILPSGRIRTTR